MKMNVSTLLVTTMEHVEIRSVHLLVTAPLGGKEVTVTKTTTSVSASRAAIMARVKTTKGHIAVTVPLGGQERIVMLVSTRFQDMMR